MNTVIVWQNNVLFRIGSRMTVPNSTKGVDNYTFSLSLHKKIVFIQFVLLNSNIIYHVDNNTLRFKFKVVQKSKSVRDYIL